MYLCTVLTCTKHGVICMYILCQAGSLLGLSIVINASAVPHYQSKCMRFYMYIFASILLFGSFFAISSSHCTETCTCTCKCMAS